MMIITVIAAVITIIGALNWLLIGAFSFDVVAAIFGAATTVTNIVYVIVGLAGLWLLYYLITLALRADRHESFHRRTAHDHRDYNRTGDYGSKV